MKNKIKNGLFTFLFIIMLLPLLQQIFPFITSGRLYGWATIAPYVTFSWGKWWDGSFQSLKNRYLNDNVGFRPDLLRLNNQIQYSLFKKINSDWIILGKDNCLYQDIYIYDYYGRDFQGYDVIAKRMGMVRAIQDTLARLGKSLIIIHAPCKAFYYPEYIPDRLKISPRGRTNFETYVHIGDSLGINQIDFNTWFVSMKNKSKDLLYPKQGFHWSVFGSALAADSLVNYIEKLRNIRMPHPVWNKIVLTEKPRSTDNDIAQMLNLIYPITTEIFSYPEIHYTEDKTFTKPNILYLGDSFLQTWLEDGLMQHTNSDYIFWANINHPDELKYLDLTVAQWIEAIKNKDCVILLYTARDLYRLGDGFIEKTYSYYFPGNK